MLSCFHGQCFWKLECKRIHVRCERSYHTRCNKHRYVMVSRGSFVQVGVDIAVSVPQGVESTYITAQELAECGA